MLLGGTTMNTFQDYLNTIEVHEKRARMEEIFDWIYKNYPQLNGVIKWNQPMFVHDNTFIIGFSIAKNHISFTPEEYTINMFSKDIKDSGYEHTKGLAKIKWEDEIDFNLLKRIIDFNIVDKKGCTTFFRK